MTITEEAKKIIMAVLENNECAAIKMATQSSCCGNSLTFDLVKDIEDVQPENIDGVPVLMDDETKEWTDVVIIDANGGQLTLVNPNAGCGSCAGGCH